MSPDNQRAIVTGGAGFVGSHLCRALREQDTEVLAIDDCSTGKQSLVPSGVSVEQVDIRKSAIPEIIERFDPTVLFHLAAIHYVPYCNDNPEETFEVNTMGTRRIVEAARSAGGLERFVFASSAAVYPPREGPNSETASVGPMDIYGRTKLAGEDLARLLSRETDITVSTARLFNIYGPDETNPHLIPAIIEQLQDGSRTVELGNLTPARDFIHVRDIVRALLMLGTRDGEEYRVYNVGSGTEWSVREVVEAVEAALGENIDVRQVSDRQRESDRPHLLADISRIEREVGWSPQVQFVDGLRELLRHEGVM